MIDENGLSVEVRTGDDGTQISTYYLTDRRDRPIRFRPAKEKAPDTEMRFRRLFDTVFG